MLAPIRFLAASSIALLVSAPLHAQDSATKWCAQSKTFAETESWYLKHEHITYNKKSYGKIGLPHPMWSKDAFVPLRPNPKSEPDTYKGVTLYTEPASKDNKIWIPVDGDKKCDFQAYEILL